MTSKSFESLFAEAQQRPEYWVEGAIIEFTEELSRVMEGKGVSRADLARLIGTSPAYVTKLLRGNANFTLATMVKLSRALGHDLRLHLAAQGTEVQWLDIPAAPEWKPAVSPRRLKPQTYSGGWNVPTALAA